MMVSKISFCLLLVCAGPVAMAKPHLPARAPALVVGQTLLVRGTKNIHSLFGMGTHDCQILRGGTLTIVNLHGYGPDPAMDGIDPPSVQVVYHALGTPGANECAEQFTEFNFPLAYAKAYANEESSTRILIKRDKAAALKKGELAAKSKLKVEHPYLALKYAEIYRRKSQAEAQIHAQCGDRLVRLLDDSWKVSAESLTFVGETVVQLGESAAKIAGSVTGAILFPGINYGANEQEEDRRENIWAYEWFNGLRSTFSKQRQSCWDAVAELRKVDLGLADKMRYAAMSSNHLVAKATHRLSKNMSSPAAIAQASPAGAESAH